MSKVIDLKAWRESRSISQQTLAEGLPVPLRTLQNWEQGRGTPPAYLGRALAHLESELNYGKRGASPDFIIMDDAQHLGPATLDTIREHTAQDDDAQEGAQPRELAYEPADD